MWSYRHAHFTVHQLPALKDNYIYIVEPDNSQLLLVIDPPEAASVAKASSAMNKRPTHILNTHHHWDHTDGNLQLKQRFDCRIVGFAGDAARIPGIDITVDEQEPLKLGGAAIRILEIPGHTTGHIAFLIDDALFCGDTIFGAGCGRLFEGSPAQMWESLKKLAALPGETSLYCAHEYTLANLRFAASVDPGNEAIAARSSRDKEKRRAGLPTIPSSIAEEIATNPFLRPLSERFRADYAERNRIADTAVGIFTHLRQTKDNA